MKKIFLTIFIFKTTLFYAQTSIQDDIDFQFQQLNSSKITTGILINKTILLNNIFAYSHDTVSDYDNFKQSYLELYNASYNRSNMPPAAARIPSRGYQKPSLTPLHLPAPLSNLSFIYRKLEANKF